VKKEKLLNNTLIIIADSIIKAVGMWITTANTNMREGAEQLSTYPQLLR